MTNATVNQCWSANGNGGAIYNKGGKITLTDAAFSFNRSVYGGGSASGGAIYAESGSKINLIGAVYLNTSSDTIVSNGTLNWDLTGKSGSASYLNDYALVNHSGDLTITVNADEQISATYLLASNAANLSGKSFIITGASGGMNATITVGAEKIAYDGVLYTLALNSDNELVLEREVPTAGEHIIITDTFSVVCGKVENWQNPDSDGGATLVDSAGTRVRRRNP